MSIYKATSGLNWWLKSSSEFFRNTLLFRMRKGGVPLFSLLFLLFNFFIYSAILSDIVLSAVDSVLFYISRVVSLSPDSPFILRSIFTVLSYVVVKPLAYLHQYLTYLTGLFIQVVALPFDSMPRVWYNTMSGVGGVEYLIGARQLMTAFSVGAYIVFILMTHPVIYTIIVTPLWLLSYIPVALLALVYTVFIAFPISLVAKALRGVYTVFRKDAT